MSDQQLTIDVVIAARNEERRLGDTLAALKMQDYPQRLVKVFVVDNRSTDKTAEIARAGGATVLSVPSGHIGAVRNAGIVSGQGNLIALLDAHCVPGSAWLSLMTAAFADDTIGACVGPFDYVCADETIASIAQARGLGAAERLRSDLISGRTSSFPWLPTGNAMYRRAALEKAGLFDESLSYCEDVDLAWRVFLLGYQFAVAPLAIVTHYNEDSAALHLEKQYKLGGAVFHMSAKYGIAAPQSSKLVEDPNIEVSFGEPVHEWRQKQDPLMPGLVRNVAWTSGFFVKKISCLFGLSERPEPFHYESVMPQFRPSFAWDQALRISISNRTVYWFVDETQCVVVKLAKMQQRYIFKDVAALIWKQLGQAASREDTISELTRVYSVSSASAAADVDEFLETLLSESLVLTTGGRK